MVLGCSIASGRMVWMKLANRLAERARLPVDGVTSCRDEGASRALHRLQPASMAGGEMLPNPPLAGTYQASGHAE